MTGRTLEALKPRLTLEELEGRTQFRTPGLWRVAPTSDYPPGEKPGINIDAGEHGADGFVCEVCGPNPDEQMRADAYFIAHAPDLLAIAQGQREELKAAETMLEGVLDTIAGIMTGYELQTEESIAWLEWHKMWKASKPERTA